MSRSSWHTGDYLTHRFNPELGIGRVTRLEPRTLLVEFPRAGKTLRLAAGTDALIAVDLGPGRPVRIIETREETTITARLQDGTVQLANGRMLSSHALWPLELEGALLERLALGHLDDLEDFVIRLDILTSSRFAKPTDWDLPGRTRPALPAPAARRGARDRQ
jgi:hypothetical protein